MARETITRDRLGFTGTTPTLTGVDAADTGDGDAFDNDGQTFVMFANTDAADALTLSIITGAEVGGLAVANVALVVAISATVKTIVGPFPLDTFNQGIGTNVGQVQLDYTGTAAAITDSDISVVH